MNKYFYRSKYESHTISNGLSCFTPVFVNRERQNIKFLVSTGTAVLVYELANKVLKHRFNLLGSGEVLANHILNAQGLEGCQYNMAPGEDEAKRVKERILKSFDTKWLLKYGIEHSDYYENYEPIDWHTDFKSGYRWDPDTLYKNIPVGHKPGADIKVPWELSRCQHFTTLGLAHILEPDNYVWGYEYVLQATDWIVSNPYPLGVNWRCTMDVAIRAVNWLWGWQLFKGHPAITEQFKHLIIESLYHHGCHIENNLEYIGRGYNGNHYISNLAGLLYIGAMLPDFAESERWVAFAIQELIEEMKHQVYEDGGSYEGSTSYHRLVTEIFYSCTAVVMQLDNERRQRLKCYDYKNHKGKPCLLPYEKQEYNLDRNEVFPEWYFAKLELMAQFIYDVTKPSVRVPQFGDNDSGRLHKFTPIVNENGAEEFNDHRHILALAGKLFGREDFTEAGKQYSLDAELLFGGIEYLPIRINRSNKKETRRGIQCPVVKIEGDYAITSEVKIDLPGERSAETVITPVKVEYYPDSGIVIYKNDTYYFAITCIPAGMNGVGGHNHNDKLSFELNVLGKEFIVDGGSYLYTSNPDIRNAFRSTWAHNTVAVEGEEQNNLVEEFIFLLPDRSKAIIENVENDRFIGSHYGYGFKHTREVLFESNKIIIKDYLEKECEAYFLMNIHPEVTVEEAGLNTISLKNEGTIIKINYKSRGNLIIREGFYSEQYGKRIKNKLIAIPFNM